MTVVGNCYCYGVDGSVVGDSAERTCNFAYCVSVCSCLCVFESGECKSSVSRIGYGFNYGSVCILEDEAEFARL